MQNKEGLRNKKVVGKRRAYLASRLTGLRERSVTLELKQGPALFYWGSSVESWTMSESLIQQPHVKYTN